MARADSTSRLGPSLAPASHRASASPSQRRAVSTCPRSSAQRPSWWLSHIERVGRRRRRHRLVGEGGQCHGLLETSALGEGVDAGDDVRAGPRDGDLVRQLRVLGERVQRRLGRRRASPDGDERRHLGDGPQGAGPPIRQFADALEYGKSVERPPRVREQQRLVQHELLGADRVADAIAGPPVHVERLLGPEQPPHEVA